ncbi:hypothetical protein PI124_g20034 [Phytophthora idaei]|nr:hypothetical protein PI125_g17264 [Phytophthora idaei]KAG3132697.1 hypothetical protein PI126_g19524 [Phytophthora idaei]KAG3234919.1 hypothetical protein PI124_g20034 [Phytophthora idaei]
MRSVNEGNLATSQDIGYDPGDDTAPQGVPPDSGAHHARRAEPAEDEPRLDPRVASHHDGLVLDQRVRSLSSFVHDANASHARLAEGLEEMHRRVDWFETPSALQNRVADLERQVAAAGSARSVAVPSAVRSASCGSATPCRPAACRPGASSSTLT